MSDFIDFLTRRPMRWGYDASTAPEGLHDVYQTLAPEPGTTYGDILPIAVDPGRSWRLAMPNVVRDGLLGVADLISGTETGEVTARGAQSMLAGGLAGGGALAPRGALAAGGAKTALPRLGLPMDEASRLQRAREMGFDVDRPLYHATKGPDFQEFGFGLGSPQSGGVPSTGIWAAEDPLYTDALAHAFGIQGSSGVRVMPLPARRSKVVNFRANGTETPEDIFRLSRNAWRDGYDAINVANRNTLRDGAATATWLFRDPNQLRSRFAKFDPAQRDSPDLMAGVAGPAPFAPGFNVHLEAPPAPGGRFDRAALPNELRRAQDRVY